MTKNPIMTTRELAKYIQLNEKTVIKLAQTGEIPGKKIGSQWRFHLDAIDRYLQEDIVRAPDEDLNMIINTAEDIVPLSKLTNPAMIKLDSKAENIDEILIELTQIAVTNGITPSKNDLLRQLERRERMLSTAIGNGVAVPHPRYPSPELFKKQGIVIVRSKTGVAYNAPDNKPVHLFFMTCTPHEFVHLRTLAKISKLLHTPNSKEKMMQAESKKQIIKILMEFDRDYLFPMGRIKQHT